ncbi:hypothetical protein Rfer_3047 [Rhodoferax ferrireducens T118]|uniref:SHOCT domain-containing protein n=1 Tax=Albidiferax ferrireducens (strain ATCC BAA-621 / DSM 15236 / T118) TaxID=338969 RepID=Q21TZ6_ALBFT|nr:SHOCT domain-containing protein [Rhodoferax ferrireducens]ABD70757.1 hypothetical protein Rfer_3047 [Rhodoferax ferrireducens T118]
MSQADELEKLSQLKEKGVLSAEEFAAKKAEILNTSSPKVKKSRRLFWAIPLLIIGTISLLNAFGSLAGHTSPVSPVSPVGNSNSSKLQCNSAVAKDTLQKAFDQSQFARSINLSAILVSDVTEQSRDAKSGELSCRATITLNTTKKAPVSYKIQQSPDGHFLLTFEVMDDAKSSSAIPVTPTPTNRIQSIPAHADFIESCVENLTEKFKKEYGDDVLVGSDMLDEWAAECQKKSPG